MIKITNGRKKRGPQTQKSQDFHFSFDKPEKKWKSVLKSIITYLGIIAGIVGAAVAIWSNWPESKEEKLRNSINENVTTILQTFHPEEINADPLHQEYKLVKDFQQRAREFATRWRAVKETDDIDKFEDWTSKEITQVISSQQKVYINYNNSILSLNETLIKITDIGTKNNIKELIPNYESYIEISNKLKQRVETSNKILLKMDEELYYLESKYGDSIPQKDLIKVVKPLKKAFKGINELSYVNELTSFIINLNSQYMLYINRQCIMRDNKNN